MKNYLLLCILFACFFSTAKSQDTTAQLLLKPAGWSFEKFALPPTFAKKIPYKGVEELRFAPGMFDKNSPSYFTYAFVAQLDNTTDISKEDISNYLLTYFRGLCASTAKEKKFSIDVSKINVVVEKKKNTIGNLNIYNATLHIFGVFTDGAPVLLNMEISVVNDAATSTTFLVCIASPKEKTDEVWKQLYVIQQQFKFPVTQKTDN